MKRILAILLVLWSIQVDAQPWFWGDVVNYFKASGKKIYDINASGDTTRAFDPNSAGLALKSRTTTGAFSIDRQDNNNFRLASYGNGASKTPTLIFRSGRGALNANGSSLTGDVLGGVQFQGNNGSAIINGSYLFVQAAEDFKDTGKHTATNIRWQVYGVSNNGSGGMDTSLKDRQQYSSATNTWAFIPIGASYNYNGGVGIGRPGDAILGRFDVGIGLPTETGVTIRGAASQTANLWQLMNSSNTVIASADANGNITAPKLSSTNYGTSSRVDSFATFDPTTHQIVMAAIPTGGAFYDSVKMATQYRLDTVKANIRTQIAAISGVSNVTATAPITSSGGSTPNIGIDTTTLSGGWHSYNYYKTVFANKTHTHAWTDITGTPTTIAGYGITDYNSLWDTRFATKHRVDSANYADTAKYAPTAGNAINLNGHADTYFTPANGTITGATKTKITYDSKGLVTAGADATTADIAASTNKNYVTDAQLVVIGNTSGTNTGDQTSVTGNAGTATTLQTARNIYGNSFNGSADVTGIISSTYGGTGNGFFTVSGPATSTKTFTFPNANATIARTDAGQTFTGVQTFSSSPVISSITNTGTHTFPTVSGTVVEYTESATTSSATPAPTGDARQNYYDLTALATAPTFAAPSGTPANHNLLTIRIKDNGTARALTWNAIYRAGTTVSLPTTTTISKTMHVQFEYNSADSKWDLVGVVDGF